MESKLCECGKCDIIIPVKDERNRPRNYARGHSKDRAYFGLRGSKHPNWKGGRILRNGYYKLHKPDHPKSDKQGYVYEHRYNFEQYYKCCLLDWVVLHHIDNDIKNNIISNLKPFGSNGLHLSTTMKKDMTSRVCSMCKTSKTFISKVGRIQWYSDKNGGWLCNSCGCKIHDKKLEAKYKRNMRLKIKNRLS